MNQVMPEQATQPTQPYQSCFQDQKEHEDLVKNLYQQIEQLNVDLDWLHKKLPFSPKNKHPLAKSE